MTASEYFESQVHFNKWLKELTHTEKIQIMQMMEEFAVITMQSENQLPPKNFTDGLE